MNELRKEYTAEDLGKGTRGKYFEAYETGTNLVLQSPDVAEDSPSDEAVDDALRMSIQIAGKTGRKRRTTVNARPVGTSRSKEKA